MTKRQAVLAIREPIESITDIMLFPGFQILHHEYSNTRLLLPNGYDVTVTRAGPYIFEILSQNEEMRDLGPYTIQIHLMKEVNPPGVVVDHIYEPPVDESGVPQCPDREEHPQAYAYFQGWKLHELKRKQRIVDIASHRKDVAMVNCVKVNNGPSAVENDDWLEPLLAVTDAPKDGPSRYLMFLKTQVVTTETIRDVIMFLWNVEEVTVEGLKSAFDQFRSRISWAAAVGAIR